MSKNCRICKYFEGYDYSDGTPYCKYDGGYECCPFNDSTEVKNNGISINIDAQFMSDYIRHTIKNSAENMANSIVEREISKIITETYRDSIEKMTEQAIEKAVNEQVEKFMTGNITIGGGWIIPERTLSRVEYLSELVEKQLSDKFEENRLKETIKSIVYDCTRKFSDELKREVNQNAKQYLDESVRKTLGDTVVSILMGSQPYMQLSERMKSLLPDETT